jgi:hypothetical protein
MMEQWELCGNCIFFCITPERFNLAMSTGRCNCLVCKHQAHFDSRGQTGHFAPSDAHDRKQGRD